jgi:hypothetical protein
MRSPLLTTHVVVSLVISAIADDPLCIAPGTCEPPQKSLFSAVFPASPRKQWPNSGGFCGSASIQTLALGYGAWVSQDVVRKSASGDGCGHGSATEGFEISTFNIGEALTNLQFQFDMFDSDNTPLPQSGTYLQWLKTHLVNLEPVVWFIMCQGDSHSACGQEWDHIEPVWALYSNNSLEGNEEEVVVYGDDVLAHASDYAPDGEANLGYYRAFNTLTDTAEFQGNCSEAQAGVGKNEMYPCLAEDHDYGVAITGPSADTERVALSVDSFEEPDLRFHQAPVNLTGTVTAMNLNPGTAYIVYRWDVSLPDDLTAPWAMPLPTDKSAYETSGATSRFEFTAAATTKTWVDTEPILSSGATYYRVVQSVGITENAKDTPAYPHFIQCGETWSDDLMDTETICAVGCLMSSTAMGIRGYNISINGIDSDPGALNEWLRDNGGYDGSNDMIETQVPLIDPGRIVWPEDGMHRTNDLSIETIKAYIDGGRVVICNVMDGGHFVLATGVDVDGDTVFVNDPGFNLQYYSFSSDIVGFRIFDMSF